MNGGEGVCEKTKETAVAKVISDINVFLERQADLIDRLHTKLEPALLPDKTATAAKEEIKEAEASKLVRSLSTIQRMMRSHNSRLLNITGRIEL